MKKKGMCPARYLQKAGNSQPVIKDQEKAKQAIGNECRAK